MRRARIGMTFEALLTLLNNQQQIPDVSVENIIIEPDRRIIDIFLIAPDDSSSLYVVAEGQVIPQIDSILRRDINVFGQNTANDIEPVLEMSVPCDGDCNSCIQRYRCETFIESRTELLEIEESVTPDNFYNDLMNNTSEVL